jgi:hypothetical protein
MIVTPKMIQEELHGIEVLRGAIEKSPHDTVSLGRDRVLLLLYLAEQALTEKLVTAK